MTMSSLGFSRRPLLVCAVSGSFPKPFSLTRKLPFLCLCVLLCCTVLFSVVNAQASDCNIAVIDRPDLCSDCQNNAVICRNCVDKEPAKQHNSGRRSRCSGSPPVKQSPTPVQPTEIAANQNVTIVTAPLTAPPSKPPDDGTSGRWTEIAGRLLIWGTGSLAVLLVLYIAVTFLILPVYHRSKGGDITAGTGISRPCDTTVLSEMSPDLRLWTEESIECLLKPPPEPVTARSWFWSTGRKLGVIVNNIRKAEYRTDMLKALREELKLRIELRNLEIHQRLTEQVASIQQVQIENHRLRVLKQRDNPHWNGTFAHPYHQLPAQPECAPAPQPPHCAPAPPPSPPEPVCPYPAHPIPKKKPGNEQQESSDRKDEGCELKGEASMKGPQSNAPYRQPRHRGRTGYSLPPDKGLRSKYPGRSADVTYEFRIRLEGHWDVVETVAFSPDGETLASAGRDKTIRFWNSRTGKAIKYETLHCESEVNSIAFSPSGELLVSGHENGDVGVWAMASLSPLVKFSLHTAAVQSVAFSPTGGTFASAAEDGTIRIWSSDLLREVKTLSDHSDEVCAVAFSPDGKLLASANRDHSICTWYTKVLPGWEKSQINQKLEGHLGDVSALTFSPNSRILASASWDRTIRLWEKAEDGSLISKPPLLEEHSESISSVAFSPDGLVLASGGWDRKVILWDAADPTLCWRVLATLARHTGVVTSVAFSKDNKHLASASDDKSVILWTRKQK